MEIIRSIIASLSDRQRAILRHAHPHARFPEQREGRARQTLVQLNLAYDRGFGFHTLTPLGRDVQMVLNGEVPNTFREPAESPRVAA